MNERESGELLKGNRECLVNNLEEFFSESLAYMALLARVFNVFTQLLDEDQQDR